MFKMILIFLIFEDFDVFKYQKDQCSNIPILSSKIGKVKVDGATTS